MTPRPSVLYVFYRVAFDLWNNILKQNLKNELVYIILEAATKATDILSQFGEMAPFALVLGDCNQVCVTREVSDDYREKQMFADQIRAMSVVERAHTVVFCMEGWQASDGWQDRASQDPNRTELVFIGVETHDGHAGRTFKTERDGERFVGLTPGEMKFGDGPDTAEGTFAQLLVCRELQEDQTVRMYCEQLINDQLKQVPFLLTDIPIDAAGGTLDG
jgi:hypothetical protein